MSQAQNTKRVSASPIQDGESRPIDTVLQQWSREKPELNFSAMGVIGEILQNAELLRREVQELWSKAGLDFPALDVILTLRRQGKDAALTPSALAQEMLLSTSAMTNRIDRLEKRGLVERLSVPGDRRSIRVRLTEDGMKMADEMIGPHVDLQNDLLRDLDENERRQLRILLAKIAPKS